MSNEIARMDEVTLPKVSGHTAPLLDELTQALGVDRAMLPSDEEIDRAWSSLPQLLSNIPPELRDEGLMRMCVAVANGLFDCGINYVWNAAIIELREKVRRFGFHAIPQIIDKKFGEERLLDLKDSGLLDLCLKLDIISEHDHFMLDQCRSIRNNFSTAHPAKGQISKDEFIHFVNRVCEHALNSKKNPQAVNIKELIRAIEYGSFSEAQYQVWCERIRNTYEAQREAIFGMLHGIYCDSDKSEETHENSVKICTRMLDKFSPSIKSVMIDRHQDYHYKKQTDKYNASQAFFEELGLIDLLSDSKWHSVLSNECKRLLDAHNGANNFYNEPAFAESLAKIIEGNTIPVATRVEFVETVLMCAVGNSYGYSHAAYPYYEKMIQEFSNEEVQIMLELPKGNNPLAHRINAYPNCNDRFARIVRLITK